MPLQGRRTQSWSGRQQYQDLRPGLSDQASKLPKNCRMVEEWQRIQAKIHLISVSLGSVSMKIGDWKEKYPITRNISRGEDGGPTKTTEDDKWKGIPDEKLPES
jgi:hypothetical protein